MREWLSNIIGLLCVVREKSACVFFCVVLSLKLSGQQPWVLQIVLDNSSDTVSIRFDNKEAAIKEAFVQYRMLLDDGYLGVKADTVELDSSLVLQMVKGDKYLLGDLVVVVKDDSSRNSRHVNTSFSRLSRDRMFERAFADFENEGYPFVSLQVDSLRMAVVNPRRKLRKTDVFVSLTRGPLIVNDSLHVRSAQPLPHNYISNYIDFKKDAVYNELHTQQTEGRLREIPFLQVKRPPEVRFTNGQANLFVFVERKKANYFNGIAGLRPDEATGKIYLTGDAEVRLANAFNHGEELGLIWRKLQPLTQDLSLRTMVPYLFKSPLAVDAQVHIYKRDTSFTAVELRGGFGVLLPRNQRLRVFVERNRTDQISSVYSMGSLTNAQQTLYGLAIQLERLDYRWNPRSGYFMQAEGALGNRVLTNRIQEAALPTKRPLTRIQTQLDYYIPVFRRQSVLLGVRGAALFSDSLYENEALRIGGLRSIRGINEESIFATAWGVATLEYRWLLEENSALYFFVDQAWYEYKSIRSYDRDKPLNFGAGFNFETKSGIFTFNYALGKQFDNPILLRNGKISFGFRNVF